MTRRYNFIFKKFQFVLVLQLLWLTAAHSTEQLSFNTDEGVIHLSDFKGKVVYVDFWASWCKPCRKSFPWMNNLQKRFAGQGVKVIAVNVDKDRSLVDQFLKTYPAGFTVAFDPEGKLASRFKVKGMPSTYIFDRNGKLVTSHIGFRKKDIGMLEATVQKLLLQKNLEVGSR